ncbi:MAG TPA: extracellular solute-binding protein [Candidatus Syntrophosphaera sp.]|nr:extracellular solute-binding protein [Anaerolineaceae bacterium]HQP27431.1 extracellular solute-binding protein [Candidatus Syntrophosphaera sp.]
MRRKSVLFVAIILIASLVLGACATATETPAPTEVPTEATVATEVPTEAAPEEPTEVPTEADPWADVVPAKEIVWWHQHTGEAREAAIAKIVSDFNATNEYGITVTAEYAGSYGDIFNKMLPILNTPDVPDVVVGYQNQVATYQLADAMFDMNELINHPKYGLPKEEQEDFFPGFFAQDVFSLFDNQRLGLAPNRSMEVMYYNMDWLRELGYDAPPTTPEEFKEMACKAAQTPFSGAIEGAASPTGYELSIDTSRFASWTFAFGGDIFDYTTNQFTLNSDAAVEAWTFIQSLFADGCARLVTENYGDQTDFGNGTLLFSVGSSSGLPFYGDAVEADGTPFEWSVAAIPHTTPDPVQNVYGASVSIPKSTPERELAAWLFVKYYTSADVNAEWAKASGYFPVRQSVAAKFEDVFAADPAYKTAFDLLKFGKFEPPVPGYDFVRDNVIEPVMTSIVDDPTSDVKALLDEANVNANDILAEQMSQIK